MSMILMPKNIDYSKYGTSTHLEAYYGLPIEVKFCKMCVISNQRPSSATEVAHNKDSKSKLSDLMQTECAMPAMLRNKKIQLTGI